MTGYRGRLAIEEVLQATEEVERRIAGNESVERINDAAREGGMRSLWESGVAHVRKGETTIDELLRVLEPPQDTKGSGPAPRVTTEEVPITGSTPRDVAMSSSVFPVMSRRSASVMSSDLAPFRRRRFSRMSVRSRSRVAGSFARARNESRPPASAQRGSREAPSPVPLAV